MSIQTMERKELYSIIDKLPDSVLPLLEEYLDFLCYRINREEGHTPNVKTILAAMKKAGNEKGGAITLDQFKAELDALDLREPFSSL